MASMTQWTILQFLQAGAYIAIMLAVLGVPQLLSSFFDLRERRRERQDAERRHQDAERRHQDAERRREDAERWREEAEQRREDRHEDRHQEVMTLLAALVTNSAGQTPEREAVIRAQQLIINRLSSENDQLRQERQNGH